MTSLQRGLTMVEVLAAMVIFSTGAVVLFGWIGQTAERLGRIDKEQIQLFSELAAIEYLRSLNPMRRPDGEETIGDARLSWQAAPVGSEHPTLAPTGTEGIYVVRLYQVRVAVETDRAGKSERLLYLTGWRQVRSGAPANPFQALEAAPAPARPPAAAQPR